MLLIFLNNVSDNKDKFTCCYEKFYKYAYCLCYDILYDKQEIDFVANRVFYKVYLSIGKVTSDDNVKAWIESIARNEAINYNKHTYSQHSHTVELDNEILYAL